MKQALSLSPVITGDNGTFSRGCAFRITHLLFISPVRRLLFRVIESLTRNPSGYGSSLQRMSAWSGQSGFALRSVGTFRQRSLRVYTCRGRFLSSVRRRGEWLWNPSACGAYGPIPRLQCGRRINLGWSDLRIFQPFHLIELSLIVLPLKRSDVVCYE